MDIQFYGANCISINYKATRLVIDDNLDSLGAKSISKSGDVLLNTAKTVQKLSIEPKIVIDCPGEYEVADISILGIPARSHIDQEGTFNTTMYKISAGEITCLITGHIYPQLGEEQQEIINMVDVLVLPVGGHGFTLDPEGALTVIKELEPKLIIPTHFADDKLHYPIPQLELETVVKDLGMEPQTTVGKLHLKPSDFDDVTRLVVLTKS